MANQSGPQMCCRTWCLLARSIRKLREAPRLVMYMKKQKQPVEAFVMVGIMILSKLRSAKNEDRIENMKEKKQSMYWPLMSLYRLCVQRCMSRRAEEIIDFNNNYLRRIESFSYKTCCQNQYCVLESVNAHNSFALHKDSFGKDTIKKTLVEQSTSSSLPSRWSRTSCSSSWRRGGILYARRRLRRCTVCRRRMSM